MRVDARDIDPLLPVDVLAAAAQGYCTLDGKKQTEVVCLDTTEGWIEKIKRTDDNSLVYNEDRTHATTKIYGKVELFNKDAVKVA